MYVDPVGDQLNRAFVQYSFTGHPHCVISKPHGNSRSSLPFIRTTPSTLGKLKESCKKKSPKELINSVTKEKGGIQKLKAAGDIPRNSKQVYNMTCKSSENDALLSIMVMCKESQGKDANPFVRVVTSAPEPMSVLCTNSQLFDIQRFCTDSICFGPISVDPTFDLGDFCVTVISFRNLMLKNRRTGKNPVMLGPMMVHRRKLFSTYHFFASSLVSLNPNIAQLLSFGTDGEECLYSAFASQFPYATHLRCFLHFRDNCKTKLQQLGVCNEVCFDVLQDILGSFLKGKQGLVDMGSVADLHDKFQSMKSKWEVQAPGFYQWFLEKKLSTVESSMLRSVREASGLGSPPDAFYTNDVESANRIIKRKTNYKVCEWPEFCRLAKELVEEQENEIEKAVIGIGDYRFDEEYVHLEVSLSKWSSMSHAQRKRHLEKIKTLTLPDARRFKTGTCHMSSTASANSPSEAFTICGEHFSIDGCQLSNDILHNMFCKAERLVLAPNSICPSPGSTTAKLVESKSEQKPHFVTKKANNRYCCDTDCPMWKCAKICSHTAYQDKCLQEFLSRITDTPNFYALAKSGTPSNAGKKPHKRKACTKSTAKALSSLQEVHSSFPVNCSTAPAVVSTHSLVSTCRVQTNHVSLPSFNQSASVTTSCTTVPSKPTSPTPKAAQSVSALLTYAPQCSVSVAQGTQGAVNVSAAVIASPQPAVMSPLVPYCTPSSLSNLHTTSTSTLSPNVIAADLVSKLISQLLPFNSPSTATSVVDQVAMTPSSVIIDPHRLFWVKIVSGNISRCQGCSERIIRGADGKPLSPPDDLVLQHKEQLMFQNPKTGNFQLSHDLRNVYYHARFDCVRRKYPTFNGYLHLRVSSDVQHRLTSQHKAYLAKEFSITLS